MSDKWVKRWDVEGSTGNSYTVAMDAEGNYGCSCPAWVFRRGECKHIQQVKADNDLPAECRPAKYREARPGKVGEVTIKGDLVLYPLVPFGGIGTHLAATIIYDLRRAHVDPEQIKDYRDHILPKNSFKRIEEYVKERGRLIYSEWVEGQGWVKPVRVPCDKPVKVT